MLIDVVETLNQSMIFLLVKFRIHMKEKKKRKRKLGVGEGVEIKQIGSSVKGKGQSFT